MEAKISDAEQTLRKRHVHNRRIANELDNELRCRGFKSLDGPRYILSKMNFDELIPDEQPKAQPGTILVNGIAVPEPMRKMPEYDSRYWYPLPSTLNGVGGDRWNNDAFDTERLRRGICHSTESAAIQHAHALIATSRIDAQTNSVEIDGIKTKLPERDPRKPAEQQGLFRKFIVQRVDGSDAPGGKHHGCRYFVLDVDHDQHAIAALTAYATACEETHPELARDLRDKWGAQKTNLVQSHQIEPEWIEWKGGERPVASNVHVEVMFGSGGRGRNIANAFLWMNSGHKRNIDIIAYRVWPADPKQAEQAKPHPNANKNNGLSAENADLGPTPAEPASTAPDRQQQRFELAKAALQGLLAHFGTDIPSAVATRIAEYADAALAELERTK